MRYKGRNIDPIKFWDRYVDFGNVKVDRHETFTHKIQCPNPNHDTTKRHFQVNLRQPTVHCFAHCGISGTWEHAIAVIEGIYDKLGVDLEIVERAYDKHPTARSVQEREQIRLHSRAKKNAQRIILKNSSIGSVKGTLPPRPGTPIPIKIVPDRELEYESYLPPVATEYLTARGFTGASIAAWNLGWLPDEKRIAIPARDENQRLKFLIKRAIKEGSSLKYLYTEGFPKTSLLFGACQIDLGMVSSGGLILVEGSLDVVWLHQLGFRNVVGILGTGISDEQVKIVARIRPPKIFLMFDKDSAGVTNIQIAAKKLRKYPLYVVRYPKGKFDPQELTHSEATRQIARSVPLVKFARSTGLNISVRKEHSFG